MSIYLPSASIPRPDFLGGGTWNLSELKDITVVVGKNGSGKSLLLRAWRDQTPRHVHYIVPERTGELDFQPQYLTEERDGETRRGQSARNFSPEYRRRIVSRIQTFFMKRGDVRSGVPAGSPDDIEDLINVLLPDFNIRLASDKNPPYFLQRVGSDAAITQVDALSSGEAQLITMSLDALTVASMWEIDGANPRLLLIDEPDAHIHPDLQARFSDFVVKMVERYKLQVVVATHSMSLLTALAQFGNTHTGTLFLDKGKSSYKAEALSDVTKELAACLGGHVLMGPLFGAPLLLVEGDDDYRIWSQVPRHHKVAMAVIPCHGSDQVKRYQEKLESIFLCLSDPPVKPIGYALLDGDKQLPQPSAKNPQQYVKFVSLHCHESENLYLTDEVLAFIGHTWMSAQEAIASAVPAFPDKQKALSVLQGADRRSVDLKGLMDLLPHILDVKRVPWTSRVSTVIGRDRPTGTLETFLGSDLVNAIWGSLPAPTTPISTGNAETVPS